MANGWRGKEKPTHTYLDGQKPSWRGQENGINYYGHNSPTPYKSEYDAMAQKFCELGATDFELAEAFNVGFSTIRRWMLRHESFCAAIKVGKEAADNRVERSLYARAVGYDFESTKFFCSEGEIIAQPFVEHVPPDTKAATVWLNNRKPNEWRNRVDVAGPNGGPIAIAISETDSKL